MLLTMLVSKSLYPVWRAPRCLDMTCPPARERGASAHACQHPAAPQALHLTRPASPASNTTPRHMQARSASAAPARHGDRPARRPRRARRRPRTRGPPPHTCAWASRSWATGRMPALGSKAGTAAVPIGGPYSTAGLNWCRLLKQLQALSAMVRAGPNLNNLTVVSNSAGGCAAAQACGRCAAAAASDAGHCGPAMQQRLSALHRARALWAHGLGRAPRSLLRTLQGAQQAHELDRRLLEAGVRLGRGAAARLRTCASSPAKS